MDSKKFLIIILSILFAFVLVIALIFGAIKFYPSVFGLSPQAGVDSSKIVQDNLNKELLNYPPVQEIIMAKLTQYQLDSINIELMKRNLDSNEVKAIIQNNKLLMDSIAKINSLISGFKDNLSKFNDSSGKKTSVSKKLNDSLNAIYNLYLKTNNELAASKEKIKSQEKAMEKRSDTLQDKNFTTFAKIYNGSDPKEVAKILEQIDEKDAAKILKLMQKKKASKVLDVMKPEVSAAILLLGASD